MDDSEVACRDRRIPTLNLRADLTCWFLWPDWDTAGWEGLCRWDVWHDSYPMSRGLWEKIALWAREYATTYFDESETEVSPQEGWDWGSFNRDGAALALELKREVGDSFRVVYCNTVEDPRSDEAREVLTDGSESLVPIRCCFVESEPAKFCRRIVSGGRLGVEEGALMFAMGHGYSYGGWSSVDGELEHASRHHIAELTSRDPQEAATLNMLESDGVLYIDLGASDASPGEPATRNEQLSKAMFVARINTEDMNSLADQVLAWIGSRRIRTLYVASPIEDSSALGRDETYVFLKRMHERHDDAHRRSLTSELLGHYTESEFYFSLDSDTESATWFTSPGLYPVPFSNGPAGVAGAILTARDPFLEQSSEPRNQDAMSHLWRRLSEQGHRLAHAYRCPASSVSDPSVESGKRPPPEWIFVANISIEETRELCVDYRQYAAIVVNSDEPSLVVIHPDFKAKLESQADCGLHSRH